MLTENLRSARTRMSPAERYNTLGERPFNGYLQARRVLETSGGPLNESVARRAHTAVLSRRSIRDGTLSIVF